MKYIAVICKNQKDFNNFVLNYDPEYYYLSGIKLNRTYIKCSDITSGRGYYIDEILETELGRCYNSDYHIIKDYLTFAMRPKEKVSLEKAINNLIDKYSNEYDEIRVDIIAKPKVKVEKITVQCKFPNF